MDETPSRQGSRRPPRARLIRFAGPTFGRKWDPRGARLYKVPDVVKREKGIKVVRL